MPALSQHTTQPEAVLSKAVLNVAQQLGMTQGDLAAVLGLHRTQISRLKSAYALSPSSKEGELALLFIRLGRALFALTGGDQVWMQHFMRSENSVTGGVPLEQIQSVQGLVSVLEFVDAIRAKV